jgi:hypothetical protein
LNLDPNLYSIQDLAVITNYFPKSPAPGSDIKVNIKVINTNKNDIDDLHVNALLPKNSTYKWSSVGGILARNSLVWTILKLHPWDEQNMQFFITLGKRDVGEPKLIINATGKMNSHKVYNTDRLVIKVKKRSQLEIADFCSA